MADDTGIVTSRRLLFYLPKRGTIFLMELLITSIIHKT